MILAPIFLSSALLSLAASDEVPLARGLTNSWPTCDSSTAVIPAAEAYDREDYMEIARLGCRFAVPLDLKAIALRCEPSALDYKPKKFTYPVKHDPTLPKAICEIEVFLPDGWKAILYTHVQNFQWWD